MTARGKGWGGRFPPPPRLRGGHLGAKANRKAPTLLTATECLLLQQRQRQ